MKQLSIWVGRSGSINAAMNEMNVLKELSETDVLFRLQDETASLAKVRDKMQKKLAKYVAFQQYLDKVLEKAEEVLKKCINLVTNCNFWNESIKPQFMLIRILSVSRNTRNYRTL
jgi:signal transduction histidine kinase